MVTLQGLEATEADRARHSLLIPTASSTSRVTTSLSQEHSCTTTHSCGGQENMAPSASLVAWVLHGTLLM